MNRSMMLGGKEIINYKRNTTVDERIMYSHRVRIQGLGKVPIIVDTVDPDLLEILCENVNHRYKTYGKEIVMHSEATLVDVLREIKVIILKKNMEYILDENKLAIGLQDLTLPDPLSEVGDLYKVHRDTEDKVLYLILMKKQTLYSYIMSVFRYMSLIK